MTANLTLKTGFMTGLAVTALLLTGCGRSAADIDKDLAASRQDVQDLKARVAALEGRVQAMEASLPVNDDSQQ